MSIKPFLIKKILKSEKIIELRRRFNENYINRKVYLYSTSPESAIVGTARIEGIAKYKTELIWTRYSDVIGCSKQELDQYSQGQKYLFAIKLGEVKAFDLPYRLDTLRKLVNSNLNPPQSYSLIGSNSDWLNAISLYELMNRRFHTYRQYV